MDESTIDIPQTPEVTEEGGKTMLKGGMAIFSSRLKRVSVEAWKRGKAIFVNRPGSSQPPEKANYQVAIPAQSNNVPRMFPLGRFHRLPGRPENIESLLLARDRQCKFEELVNNMIGDTPKIREWYLEVWKWYDEVERRLGESNTELGRMRLGRMMARSGLLLLEFLRFLALPDLPRSSNEFFQPKDPWSLQKAVIKIDNQIPFFVLKKILEWERDENRQADTDLHSILKDAWLKLSPIQLKDDDSHVIAEVQLKDDSHLLQFLYENIIGSSDFKRATRPPHPRKNKRHVRHCHINLPQAEQLQGKGVKFAPNEGLLDKIYFNRGRLYLPTIKMDGGTAAVLKNLVLFEISKQEKRSQPLMSYVDLMERLIDTAEDVQALRDVGIIDCHLPTNNEVANVCNGMRELLPNKKIKYEPIDKAIYDVIRFYTSKCRILYIEFKHSYCSKPWIVISVISACILFALAGLQTYLTWEQVRLQRESMPKT